MPLNKNLKKVMVIGSGPIVIGQAAEFDYAGTQACRALKEEGLEVVLVNSNPATIMTDRERIQRIFSGEPEQMNELIEEYYQDIFQYCYSQTRRESAAYDCTQETFLRVIRYLNRYVEQKKFRAYLFGIARSVCIDFFRKKSESEVGYEEEYEETLREEDFADRVSEQVTIKKAMEKLKEEQREVLDLSYYHGLTAKEIAYVTGERVTAVKSRIRQSLKKLRQILEEEGFRWNG